MKKHYDQRAAQVAIEYLLMLGGVVIVILIAMTTLLPKAQDNAGNFFNQAAVQIMGNHAVDKARSSDTNYP